MSNINVNLNFTQVLKIEDSIEHQIIELFKYFKLLRQERDRYRYKVKERLECKSVMADQVRFVKELNKVRRELKAHRANVLNKACGVIIV